MMVMVTVMQMLAMMLMIWDGGGDTMATRATPPPPLFCESRWATVPAGASLFFARLRRVLHVSYLYGAPRH